MIRFRHRMRWFRAALLGVLALCMVVQPVLAASGELHESFEHPEQAALHLEGAGHHDAPVPADGEPAEVLHVLLHFAHCCGHPASFDIPSPGANWTPADDMRPMGVTAAPVLRPQRGAPFRPPIQA